MDKQKTFAEKVLQFNTDLSNITLELPEDFKIINPYNGDLKHDVKEISRFYQKYYSDIKRRRLILGSSPARRGTAITGVPFEDADHIQKETGIKIENFYINKSTSGFLYDVMNKYGGCDKFYADYYMNFVCPLCIVKTISKDNEVNCNYYDSKKLQDSLYSFIISSIHALIELGIDTSVCYCIGSGKNYAVLSKINGKYHFFNKIIPLEHPRFIMQYNSKNKDLFIEKYLKALNTKN